MPDSGQRTRASQRVVQLPSRASGILQDKSLHLVNVINRSICVACKCKLRIMTFINKNYSHYVNMELTYSDPDSHRTGTRNKCLLITAVLLYHSIALWPMDFWLFFFFFAWSHIHVRYRYNITATVLYTALTKPCYKWMPPHQRHIPCCLISGHAIDIDIRVQPLSKGLIMHRSCYNV